MKHGGNHHYRRSKQSGFTLVEILLGGVIAVVILSALLLLMHSVISVRESQAAEAGAEALRDIQEEMAGQLRHLAPGGSNECELVTSADSLSFCAFEAGSEGWETITAFRYTLLDDGSLEQVVQPRGSPATTNLVLGGVADFTVRSFHKGAWQESGAGATPEMLQIQMALETEENVTKTVFIPASIQVRSTLERR